MALKVIALIAFAGVVTVFAASNDHVQKVHISPRDACDETCASKCAAAGYEGCDETHCYCETPTARNVTLPKADTCDITCDDECATYGDLTCIGIGCDCH